MNRPEEALQKAAAEYLELALPPDCYWFAVPNQRGTRKRWENELLKAMGVKAGAPDIILLSQGRFVGFELKADKGKMSTDQVKARGQILSAGGNYFVIKSVEDLEFYLVRILAIPLRARITTADLVTREAATDAA